MHIELMDKPTKKAFLALMKSAEKDGDICISVIADAIIEKIGPDIRVAEDLLNDAVSRISDNPTKQDLILVLQWIGEASMEISKVLLQKNAP